MLLPRISFPTPFVLANVLIDTSIDV